MTNKRARKRPETTQSGRMLKIGDVADRLNVSRSKVYAMIRSGSLQYCKFDRLTRVPENGLEEYIESCVQS